MDEENDTDMFYEHGMFSDDDDLQNNGDVFNDTALMNAVRSAAEMLAAEGLGSMVNIDTIQRQQRTISARAFEQQNYDYQSIDADEALSDASGNQPLISQFEDLTLPTTRVSRSTRARNINHGEQDLEVGYDSNFEPFDNDDDEDSNYEEGEMDSSSGDDEHHIQAIHEAMRESAGFSKSNKSKRGLQGRRQKVGKQGRRRRGRQMRQPTYSLEVQNLLGNANRFYVEKELTQAFNTFCDVIRIDPSCAPAWYTMALIREEQCKHSDALQLYTVAAHMNSSDNAMWERLYVMHMDAAEQNKAAAAGGDAGAKQIYEQALNQALYCVKFVIKNDPQNKDAWARRLALLERKNDQRGITKAYKSMLRADPYNMEAIRAASVIYAKKNDDIDTPVKWFTDAFDFYNKQAVELAEQAVTRAIERRERRSRRKRRHRGGLRGKKNEASDDSESGVGNNVDDEISDGSNEDDARDDEWAEYFENNPTKTVPMEDMDGYSYNDLNMLAELRLLRREYEATIVDIKRGARFIQGRGREAEWEDQELNDEFDSEYLVGRDDTSEATAHNELPIELRVKLGQCRLLLGHTLAAEGHINHLLCDFDIVGYEDLFTDVADAYAEIENHHAAIDILTLLANQPETNQPSVWERLAKCYRDRGDLDSACKYALMVIDADPNDLDMRLWLGEVYEEMGEVQQAFEMINVVEEIQLAESQKAGGPVAARRRRRSVGLPPQSHAEAHEAQAGFLGGLGPNVMHVELRKPSEHTMQKRRHAEEERKRCLAAMRNAEVAFKKLDLLRPQIDQLQDAGDIKEYCVTAQRLFADWRHTGALYLTDRSRPFRSYRSIVMISLESGAQHGDIDMLSPVADGQAAVQRRLARMKQRLSNRRQRQLDGASKPDDDAVTTFRGQQFDRWFNMFLMYGKCLALDNEFDDALEMLDTVFQSNVFINRPEQRRCIRLLMLAIALRGGSSDRLHDVVRWWSGSKPAKAMMYKLFGLALASSASAAATLTSANIYKFIRRQLEHLDALYLHRAHDMVPAVQPVLQCPADESRNIAFRDKDRLALTNCDVSLLHSLAAHVMLVARTGATSVVQYGMALALMPLDASVALHLGVSYLMHSTKREVRDRQATAVRGMVYIERYAELRYIQELKLAGRWTGGSEPQAVDVVVVQEIAYNYARAFHFLGLTDLAITYYNRVFALPVSLADTGCGGQTEELLATRDLRRDTAYNLASIYAVAGSVLKSKALLLKYCTIG
ncbi:hypothetical protein BX070DRAFT_12108 [Coemansia spiralis]|nr:hypothetical protein BX070DRAFT_12108 [Coemansia spiralis]